MKRHPAHTLHVLEHIGLPLIIATIRAGTPRLEEIEKVREMLDRTVQCAQELEKIIVIPEDKKGKLPLKLEMAAISSNIIGNYYQTEKILPQEDDLKRIVQLIDTTLLFSDGYAKLTDDVTVIFNQDILPPSTEMPYHVKIALIFSPVINAIAEFSYGLPENQLIRSVSEKLSSKAKEAYIRLINDSPPASENDELLILRALINLYADTHIGETQKMMRMDPRIRMENSSQITIDIVWRAFEKKYAMLEALVEGLVPAEIPKTHTIIREEINPLEGFEIAQETKESPLSFFVKSKN